MATRVLKKLKKPSHQIIASKLQTLIYIYFKIYIYKYNKML
jgi:hypothetical protein